MSTEELFTGFAAIPKIECTVYYIQCLCRNQIHNVRDVPVGGIGCVVMVCVSCRGKWMCAVWFHHRILRSCAVSGECPGGYDVHARSWRTIVVLDVFGGDVSAV